jgi:transcriptional regulator with XRE-family HTH domain
VTQNQITYADLVVGTIRAHLSRRGITQRRLAEMLGRPEDWVSRRLRGSNTLTVNDVATIAAALELDPWDMFSQAVIAC